MRVRQSKPSQSYSHLCGVQGSIRAMNLLERNLEIVVS